MFLDILLSHQLEIETVVTKYIGKELKGTLNLSLDGLTQIGKWNFTPY